MVRCPITIPFEFGLHVKVFHVQDEIHVVLGTEVGPGGGVHAQLERMARKSAWQGPGQRAHTANSCTEGGLMLQVGRFHVNSRRDSDLGRNERF